MREPWPPSLIRPRRPRPRGRLFWVVGQFEFIPVAIRAGEGFGLRFARGIVRMPAVALWNFHATGSSSRRRFKLTHYPPSNSLCRCAASAIVIISLMRYRAVDGVPGLLRPTASLDRLIGPAYRRIAWDR